MLQIDRSIINIIYKGEKHDNNSAKLTNLINLS